MKKNLWKENEDLFNTIKNNKLEDFKILLEKKLLNTKVGEIYYYNRNPLEYAIERNCIDIIKHLLNKGVNINARTKDGLLPLASAALLNNIEVVELLLKNGAEIDSKDGYGNTALDYALYEGYDEIVNELLEKNARKDIPTRQDITSQDLIDECNANNNSDKNISQIENIEIYNGFNTIGSDGNKRYAREVKEVWFEKCPESFSLAPSGVVEEIDKFSLNE